MAKKLKIPKRLAGVKIPKAIRKGPLGDFVQSSAGQLVLANALIALGGWYAARNTETDSATGRTLRHPLDAAKALAADPEAARERLSHAFTAAAQAFRDALEDGADSIVESAPNEESGTRKKSKDRDARAH